MKQQKDTKVKEKEWVLETEKITNNDTWADAYL